MVTHRHIIMMVGIMIVASLTTTTNSLTANINESKGLYFQFGRGRSVKPFSHAKADTRCQGGFCSLLGRCKGRPYQGTAAPSLLTCHGRLQGDIPRKAYGFGDL